MKLKGLSAEETQELLPDQLILLGYRGSIAHGTYVPSTDPCGADDKDVLGVFVGPPEHYIGFGRREHYERFKNEWDVVCYELRKFARLLLKSNPNVLSLLWLNENRFLYQHRLGKRLRANRHLFVSKAAYHSFNGYAYGQFKRMTQFKFNGYMGEKRKALVQKFGYDCKNAAHLIRLLRMGIEFLVEGVLFVERKDAPQLVSIKKGEWTLEQVKKEAERLFVQAEEAYMRSTLPDKPDRDAAEKLVMDIIRDYPYFAAMETK